MGTVRKTITLTPQQDQWIKARIAAGGFTNDSEYIRDLIRRDQEQQDQWIKARIAAGGFTNDSEYIRDLIRRDQEQNAKSRQISGAGSRDPGRY